MDRGRSGAVDAAVPAQEGMVAPPRNAWRDAWEVVREHGLEMTLVLLGTTLPRLFRKGVLGLRVAAAVLVAVGAFAVLRPDWFLAALPYVLGAMFLALGIGLLWAAGRIQEATSAVRLAEKAIEAFRERGRAP